MKTTFNSFRLLAIFILLRSFIYGMETYQPEMENKEREFGLFRYSPKAGSLGFACLVGNPRDIKTTKLYLGMYWMDTLKGMPVFSVGPVIITNVNYPVSRYRHFMREFGYRSVNPKMLNNMKLVEQYRYHVLSTTMLDVQKKEGMIIKVHDIFLHFGNFNRAYLHQIMTQNPRTAKIHNYWRLLSFMRISVHTKNSSLTRACWTMRNGTTWRWWNNTYQHMKFGAYLQGKQDNFIEE